MSPSSGVDGRQGADGGVGREYVLGDGIVVEGEAKGSLILVDVGDGNGECFSRCVSPPGSVSLAFTRMIAVDGIRSGSRSLRSSHGVVSVRPTGHCRQW